MKITPIGVGQAGGKVVDQLASHCEDADLGVIAGALAVNSSRPDLVGLRHLPQDRRVLIGQSEVDGHGVGKENERGAELLNDDIEDVIYRLEETSFDEDSEAFLLVGGLGGGMGSGGMPVLAKYLRDRYDLPVYAVGILPTEGEGQLASLNAMRSLSTLVHLTDNVILFDNAAWVPDDNTPIAASYSSMNEQLVINLATLLAATEPAGGGPVGEQVLDTADLKATLETGDLSTIGYSDAELERQEINFIKNILGKKGDAPDNTSDQVETVLQEAALGKLTAPATLTHIESTLGLVAAPPEFLSQNGLESASQWLDDETDAENLRVGDFPIEADEDEEDDHDYMAGIVVLSGLTVVERLIELYDRVVGLDTLAGMDNVEVEATDVMEEFFVGEESPDPLFVTDEYDPSALRVVDNEIEIDENVGRDVDEFDWRMDEMDDNTEPDDADDINASAEVFDSEDGEESTSAADAEDGTDDSSADEDGDDNTDSPEDAEEDEAESEGDEETTDTDSEDD